MIEYFALERLIKSKLVAVSGSDIVHAYAFGWTLVSIVFKHSLSLIFSDKGEEADYDDYFMAAETTLTLVAKGCNDS